MDEVQYCKRWLQHSVRYPCYEVTVLMLCPVEDVGSAIRRPPNLTSLEQFMGIREEGGQEDDANARNTHEKAMMLCL
jgi:hypothetical protein